VTTFTVTATDTAATLATFAALKVFVVTSVSAAGGNSAGFAGGWGVTNDVITPAQAGSLLLFGLAQTAGTWSAYTTDANNTLVDNAQYAATGYGYADGYYSGPGGSGLTVGASGPAVWTASGVYELVPHNGAPAIDGSTPAVAVTDATTAPVTASFTPPSGSVLCAVLMANSTGTPVIAMSDTSGLGLTWTQQLQFSASYEGTVTIMTATMPGGGTAIALASAGTGTEAIAVPAVKSPPLQVSGFGTFPAVGASDTINFVQVSVTEYQSSVAMPACSFELWDNGITQIGTTQTGTRSQTPGNVSTAQFRPTYAQLATLQVRVYGNAPSGTGDTENVDAVGLVVDYTPASGTFIALAGSATGTDTLGGTSSLQVLTTSLPNAIEGTAYSAGLTATGGTPPYTWTIVSGALPPWATLT